MKNDFNSFYPEEILETFKIEGFLLLFSRNEEELERLLKKQSKLKITIYEKSRIEKLNDYIKKNRKKRDSLKDNLLKIKW